MGVLAEQITLRPYGNPPPEWPNHSSMPLQFDIDPKELQQI